MYKTIINFLKKYPKIYKIYQFLDGLDTRISNHHLLMLASAIAFNIILYQIPLMLMTLYIVDISFGFENLAGSLNTLISEFIPPTEETQTYIDTILAEVQKLIKHSSLFGYVGIGILLWLSSALISSIRYGLNTIFNIPSEQIFLVYRFKDMGLTILFSILILLYSYIVPLLSFVYSSFRQLVPKFLEESYSFAMVNITSALTAIVFFYCIYRFVPNKKIERKIRILATLLSVFVIEITKYIFAWYLESLSSYGKFYGTYAILVSMAIWIYYSSLILLLSAELSKYIFDLRDGNVEDLE